VQQSAKLLEGEASRSSLQEPSRRRKRLHTEGSRAGRRARTFVTRKLTTLSLGDVETCKWLYNSNSETSGSLLARPQVNGTRSCTQNALVDGIYGFQPCRNMCAELGWRTSSCWRAARCSTCAVGNTACASCINRHSTVHTTWCPMWSEGVFPGWSPRLDHSSCTLYKQAQHSKTNVRVLALDFVIHTQNHGWDQL